jgi:NAD(P)-dependent dehydrogenase (short-subunit alcohol dehydrogenase family)
MAAAVSSNRLQKGRHEPMNRTLDTGSAPTASRWGLEGRAIVVTGASSGIGAGVARHLGAEGATVIAVGRDEERLQECAAAIGGGGACVPVRADLVDPDGPRAVVVAAVEACGRIDGLVHTAGIFSYVPFEEAAAEVLDAQYEVNVRAPYALTHAALPHLGEGSTVVFVSSNLAQVGMAGAAAYCGSKGAVDALARALALELAPRGIRINTVAPGIVRTPMTHRLDEDEEQLAAVMERTPAGRLGEPQDIAEAVAYLSSEASGYMVGSTVVIDGGWNAH